MNHEFAEIETLTKLSGDATKRKTVQSMETVKADKSCEKVNICLLISAARFSSGAALTCSPYLRPS